jgi:hypothetical protein
MPKDMEFEALLWVARAAYERRAGAVFDPPLGTDFETFANRDGWPPL